MSLMRICTCICGYSRGTLTKPVGGKDCWVYQGKSLGEVGPPPRMAKISDGCSNPEILPVLWAQRLDPPGPTYCAAGSVFVR